MNRIRAGIDAGAVSGLIRANIGEQNTSIDDRTET